MADVEIWHYPRCSKSRQGLALLQEKGIEPDIRRYMDDPPDAQTLDDVLTKLDMEPREFMRTKEDAYGENDLDDQSLTREQLIEAMIDHPRLIQRPVVISGDKVALGRPPKNVLDVL